MDWFKRYGISGAYFLVLVSAWLYAFCSCWPFGLEIDDLAKLAAFIFLPVGYIISVLNQGNYLLSREGGLHRAAANRVYRFFVGEQNKKFAREPDLEALSCLTTALVVNQNHNNIHGYEHIQKWIQRRMDVLVINRTIEFSTKAAFVVGLGVSFLFGGRSLQPSIRLIILLIIISLLTLWIMWRTRRTLEEQITIAISGAFQALQDKQVPFDETIWRSKVREYPPIGIKENWESIRKFLRNFSKKQSS